MLVCLAVQTAEGAELKKETAALFDRYIGASEGRIKSELDNGLFHFFIDELPETRRVEAYAQLRMGQGQRTRCSLTRTDARAPLCSPGTR